MTDFKIHKEKNKHMTNIDTTDDINIDGREQKRRKQEVSIKIKAE